LAVSNAGLLPRWVCNPFSQKQQSPDRLNLEELVDPSTSTLLGSPIIPSEDVTSRFHPGIQMQNPRCTDTSQEGTSFCVHTSALPSEKGFGNRNERHNSEKWIR
jgi:hypothetical protein